MPGHQRELRRTRRKPKRQAAWISYGANNTPIPCVIWDLSEEGARLAPARSDILPDFFILVLKHVPQKREPVLRRRTCSNKMIERDDDAKKSHPTLAKDGKSHRLCRVVWRKNRHMGVQFVQPGEADMGLDPGCPTQSRKAVTARYRPPRAPDRVAGADNSLSLQGHHPHAASRIHSRRHFASSSLAVGLLFLLVVATAVFYVAGLQIDDGTPWALKVCDNAKNLCDHPEMSGIPAVLMTIVYCTVKGMEL
jgi:hypothetical protein